MHNGIRFVWLLACVLAACQSENHLDHLPDVEAGDSLTVNADVADGEAAMDANAVLDAAHGLSDAAPGDAALAPLDAEPTDAGFTRHPFPPVMVAGEPGALDCGDAPVVREATRFGQPEIIVDAHLPPQLYTRLEVAPKTAMGVRLAGRGGGAAAVRVDEPVACAQCADFQDFASSCRVAGPAPQRLYRGAYSSTGNPLVVNLHDAPQSFVHVTGQAGGIYETITLPVADVASPEICAEGINVPAGVGVAGGCRRRFTVQPGRRAIVFGQPAAQVADWANMSEQPITHEIDIEGPFAWVDARLPTHTRCDSPARLNAGEVLRARLDLHRVPDELCGGDAVGFGNIYLQAELPPFSRGILYVETAIVADGGGGPLVKIATVCERAAPCETEQESPFALWTAVPVENAGASARTVLFSVQQSGIGYEGNAAAVLLDLE